MLFNSLVFPLFFVLVYAIYRVLGKRWKAQNLLLLVASYVFYGWWDWRFLGLIAGSTLLDYFVGQSLALAKGRKREGLLLASLVANLGLLAVFKYFNFFADSAADLLAVLGFQASWSTLNIVLPVGISFYTFQTLSYTIDIYRGQLKPIRSLPDFALYVSFFPQLVAGPIERASRLLPQITAVRKPSGADASVGLWLIAWGYFKKVVIADRMALIANEIFNNYEAYSGLDLTIAVLAFAFQIYGDFSGYTDIARGVARLLGFNLMLNFRLPYLAISPSEFWLRWHVSLSSWLRDYLYIPLGGNRKTQVRTLINLMLTMLLGGLWHGPAWHFVLWGAFHGTILIAWRIAPTLRLPSWLWGPRVALMFVLTLVGWLIFRAPDLATMGWFLTHAGMAGSAHSAAWLTEIALCLSPLLLVQFFQHRTGNLLVPLRLPAPAVGILIGLLMVGLLIFGVREPVEFIYFQF